MILCENRCNSVDARFYVSLLEYSSLWSEFIGLNTQVLLDLQTLVQMMCVFGFLTFLV